MSSRSGLASNRFSGSSSGSAGNSPRNRVNQDKEGEICRFYADNGFCQWGDRCRYVHIDKPRLSSSGSRGGSMEAVPRKTGVSRSPAPDHRSGSGTSSSSLTGFRTPSTISSGSDEIVALQQRGVVLTVKESFGFIKFASGKSVFYHSSAVQSANQTLREGDEVECDLIMGKGNKEEAVNVRLLGGISFLGGAKSKTSSSQPDASTGSQSTSSSASSSTASNPATIVAPVPSKSVLPSLAPQWRSLKNSPVGSPSGSPAPVPTSQRLLPALSAVASGSSGGTYSLPMSETSSIDGGDGSSSALTKPNLVALGPSWMNTKKKQTSATWSNDSNNGSVGRQINSASSIPTSISMDSAERDHARNRAHNIASALGRPAITSASQRAGGSSNTGNIGSRSRLTNSDSNLPSHEGTVSAVKADKGFGFIDYTDPAGKQSSMYFRLDAILGGIALQRGDKVEFRAKPDPRSAGQLIAVNVRMLGADSIEEDDYHANFHVHSGPSSGLDGGSFLANEPTSANASTSSNTGSGRFPNTGAMRRWLESFERDPHQILMHRDELEEFLDRQEIPFSVIDLLLQILTHSELRLSGGADRLYKCVLDSPFVRNPRNLRSFMIKLWSGETASQRDAKSLSNAVALVDELMDRFPECIHLIHLDVLEGSLDKIRAAFSSELVSEIMQLLAQKKITRDRVTKKHRDMSAELKDEDDFREIPLFPTAEELSKDPAEINARLNKNVVAGKYDSVMHYLDTHFRLLREDAITSIRDGIKAYKRELAGQADPTSASASREIQVYKNVKMSGITTSSIGVQYRLSFALDIPVNWERSKRLMFGSLLCLSPDGFNTLLWATVASRDAALLASKQQIDIRFAETTAGYEGRFDPHATYTMAESVSTYYEAYYHVLQALQNTPMDKFPFLDYLINCKPDVAPPSYLAGGADLFNMYNVFDAGTTTFNLLKEWPSDLITSMDDSQMAALKQALTKELAVIQGPPGTGKTFVGLKVMRALLENRNLRPRAPILVVCYTNHALDQFLEGVLKFESNIVRIGSRSKSEELKERNIRVLTQQLGLAGREQTKARKQINQNIRELQEQLDMCFEELKKTTLLRADIEAVAGDIEGQVDSLFSRAASDAPVELVLESWLGMSTRDLVSNQLKQLAVAAAPPRKAPSVTSARSPQMASSPNFDAEEELDDELLTEMQNERMVAEDDDDPTRGTFEFDRDLSGPIPPALANCSNVWDLSRGDRGRLYLHWLAKYRNEHAQSQLEQLCEQYERLVKEKKSIEADLQLQVLSDANVIGMTTTGVAKFQRLIQQAQPSIIIVEEAAEVLEAHIIASLSSATKHLVLIGDHEQLRPSTAVYRLATKYHLDVSLFERMVNNKLEVKTLLRQRRMRPDISALIKPIYPNLYNHPDVSKYPNVKGIASNLYFIDHELPESGDSGDASSLSKTNKHEALFIARLCQHLLLQGYSPKQITVLTAYSGQVKLIRQEIRFLFPNANTSVYVTSVDNYQGEENDIILLSLVRSNQKGIIGFLSTSNRICVALSRAKHGMYIVGNGRLLASRNTTWAKIIGILKQANQFGPELKLQCQNHPEKKIVVSRDTDFKKAEDGGCDKPCGQLLDCGHKCPRLCHPYPHSEVVCHEPCKREHAVCGHLCMRRCSDECGECEVPVLRKLACGHDPYVPCHIPDSEYRCESPCQKILPCGHKCPLPCGFDCVTKCREVVTRTLACKHTVRVECNVDIALLKCEQPGCTSNFVKL